MPSYMTLCPMRLLAAPAPPPPQGLFPTLWNVEAALCPHPTLRTQHWAEGGYDPEGEGWFGREVGHGSGHRKESLYQLYKGEGAE